ncbi:MAG TPA: hypothetical protein VJ957_00525 [Longimicrobiales bacterium]|nr:hypothetical protein [Longimicrobiales bacterium]
MKKLLIALVVVAAVLSASPRLREKAAPRLAPVWNGVKPWIKKPLHPFIAPLQKQHASSEVLEIMGALKEDVLHDRGVPRTSDFVSWINKHNLTDHQGVDPWGKPYELLQASDTLYVVSLGPDTTLNTPDDIRAGFPHRR